MASHVLNLLPIYFDDVASGVKPFEIRRGRTFDVDDTLIFRETRNGVATGRACQATVSYVRPPSGRYGIPDDVVIVGLRDPRMLS